MANVLDRNGQGKFGLPICDRRVSRRFVFIIFVLRDERDWDPAQMTAVTKSYGGKLLVDEAELAAMPKKECRRSVTMYAQHGRDG